MSSDPTSLLHGRRHEKRPKAVVAGSAFFGLLSAAALVELARGAPLHFGTQVAAPGESVLYRLSAAVTCAALAGWLYLVGGRRRDGDHQ